MKITWETIIFHIQNIIAMFLAIINTSPVNLCWTVGIHDWIFATIKAGKGLRTEKASKGKLPHNFPFPTAANLIISHSRAKAWFTVAKFQLISPLSNLMWYWMSKWRILWAWHIWQMTQIISQFSHHKPASALWRLHSLWMILSLKVTNIRFLEEVKWEIEGG